MVMWGGRERRDRRRNSSTFQRRQAQHVTLVGLPATGVLPVEKNFEVIHCHLEMYRPPSNNVAASVWSVCCVVGVGYCCYRRLPRFGGMR